MLFDHEFHEKLLSFVRNIASILLFGGFAILIIYRVATKEDLSLIRLITANFIGYTMLLWSFYLGLINIIILRYDFIKYLKRQYTSLFSFNQDIEHISSTSKISYRLMQHSKFNSMLYAFRYIAICCLGMAFVMLYFLGIIAIFAQQLKVFGFELN